MQDPVIPASSSSPGSAACPCGNSPSPDSGSLSRATAMYNAAAAVVVFAMLFQVVEPLRRGTADGVSLTMVVLLILGAVLRIPFFVCKARADGASPWKAYSAPLAFLVALIFVYCLLLGVKLYFELGARVGS